MTSNSNLGAYGIMYVIENKKNEVISLLLKNGVTIPSNATNIQIGLVVTNLLKSSKSFYKDFSKLLLTQEVIDGVSVNCSGCYASADGVFDFSQYTIDPSPFLDSSPKSPFPKTTTKPSTKTLSTSNSGFINQGLNILQTAFQGYLQLDDNKTKRALADASVKITENPTLTPPPPTGLSTGAIIGLSLLGIAVVGAIAYVIIKKK
jgi:hypothetical protein